MLKTIRHKEILTFIFFQIIIIMRVSGQDHENIDLANQYYQQGENDKALLLFEKLAKSDKNIPFIHENYFSLLLFTGRYNEAEKYINKVIKNDPENVYYTIDKGLIYVRQNNEAAEKKYFNKVISSYSSDQFKIRLIAQYFIKNQLPEYALETFKAGRVSLHTPGLFAIQMAGLYRVLNKKDLMVEEYLIYANESPRNVTSVKNVLQSVLSDPEDLDMFEQMMYDKIQKDPDSGLYNDLLIWVNIQKKDFYSAFIQARAIDKRLNLGGDELMELGQIALKNKDYKNSVKIFQYIVDEYPGLPNYQIAKRLVINSREEMVKNTFPVNSDEIRKLINDYSALLNDFGINNNTIDAMRNKALLYAFYLNKYDSASLILEKIIRIPRINKSVVDRSKLDLGDIYLLMEQPWESTLLYYQVEKSSKDSPIGYEAKLKNARLSYYKGDFSLAQSHLDILKLATTREIANDAMSLSLLIKDNTKLDSADKALKRFADIDLLIFQNKKFAALDSLKKLIDDIGEHSLVDEILYREANLNLEMGNFDESVELLKTLGEKYGDDILGDDALFLLGEIYELHLKDKENAMNTYRDFLVKYPGSNHAAEARKRFRILRGDYL